MLLDSSILLEILLKQPLFEKCEKTIQGVDTLYISVLSYFECYKKIRLRLSESEALEVVGYFENFKVIDISKEISLLAADLSLEHSLSMADSLVLATAKECRSILLTLDNDFTGIPGARVVR